LARKEITESSVTTDEGGRIPAPAQTLRIGEVRGSLALQLALRLALRPWVPWDPAAEVDPDLRRKLL
jgi:hypothetical protein